MVNCKKMILEEREQHYQKKKFYKFESTKNNRKNDSNPISIYKFQCLNLDR